MSAPPRLRSRGPLPDPHALYETAVQSVDYDLGFLERVYRRLRGRSPLRLREDFCGTAALACGWAARGPERRAWGVDHDARVLAWARAHHVAHLREVGRRVTLVCGDVRRARVPRVDVICALNFSYWVFHARRDLLGYLRAARRGLAPGGLLFLSLFGGSDAMGTLTETRRVAASRGPDGERLPGFDYVWEQASFNPVDHRLRSHIHFRLRDGRRMRRAFTYDWRLWTLPELTDALREAGFARARVFVEGWDARRNRPAGDYRERRRFEQQEGWLAMLVGAR